MPGKIVETKQGIGKTDNADPFLRNKILVYLNDGTKLLCSVEKINIIGYWD